MTIDNSRFNRSNTGKVGNCIGGKQENLLQYNDVSDENDTAPILMFEGDNVIIGTGSLLTRRNKHLRIQFNESSTLTYEYPSEESLIAMANLGANAQQDCETETVGNRCARHISVSADHEGVETGDANGSGSERKDEEDSTEDDEKSNRRNSSTVPEIVSSIGSCNSEPLELRQEEQKRVDGSSIAKPGTVGPATASAFVRKSKYRCAIVV